MSLTFPNQSRSYDDSRNAVRFWGHDGAMEASFLVDGDALRQLQPDIQRVEADTLNAFDLHRARIQATAVRVYERTRKASYILSPTDF